MKIKEFIAEHERTCGYTPVIDPDDDGKGFGWKCDVCGSSGYASADEDDDDGGTTIPQVGVIDNNDDALAGAVPPAAVEQPSDGEAQAPDSRSLTERYDAMLDQSSKPARVAPSVTKQNQKGGDGEGIDK